MLGWLFFYVLTCVLVFQDPSEDEDISEDDGDDVEVVGDCGVVPSVLPLWPTKALSERRDHGSL